ncbi:MAG TPA: hypothetical protein VFZ44_04310 [Pyrinomonadaceae bacterium]
MNCVLDACAMIALLKGEPGENVVWDKEFDPVAAAGVCSITFIR